MLFRSEIGGTSTVNQETVVIHGGSNSARLDIDASNSTAQFYQTFASIAVGKWVQISYWLRSSAVGKTGYISGSSFGLLDK